MKRGRPTRSAIRQNMIEILYHLGQAYGYEIYKVYKECFDPVTLRVMYYHLKKGVVLGEFKKEQVKIEEGNYSWGTTVEKIYYSLGPSAKTQGNEKVREFVEKYKAKKKS